MIAKLEQGERMDGEAVELHGAFSWDCPECGRENFVRSITVEMTPEDIAEFKADHGGEDEDWQTGKWMTRPDEVVCSGCRREYPTTEWGETPDDE